MVTNRRLGNHVKGTIMLPIVAPMRTDNQFKDTAKIKQRQYISLLKALNFDVANIEWFTV